MKDRLDQLLGDLGGAVVGASHQRPWLTVALCALLTVGTGYLAATRLAVETDTEKITDPSAEFKATRLALDTTFDHTQRNLIVLVEAEDAEDAREAAEDMRDLLARNPEAYTNLFLPGSGEFYEDNGLFYLEEEDLRKMHDRIDQSGELLATLRETPELPILIGAVTHVISSEDGIESLGEDGVRILSRVSESVEAFNAGRQAPVDWEDLLFGDFDVEYMNPQFLLVNPALESTNLDPVMGMLEGIREAANELQPRPGLRVRVTGEVAVNGEEMSLILGEAVLAGGGSLLLVAAILLYALRSFRLLLAVVVTLLVGLVWTAGFAGLAVGHLNVLTVACAVVYIGLGVDFGIHFALGYIERRLQADLPPTALDVAGRRVGSSLLFCALSTAIGFYAFIPTDFSAVSELGLISGTGVFLSLLATLTLFPALIALGMGESPKFAEAPSRRFEIKLPQFPLRYPRVVCGVAAVVFAGSLFCLGWVRFDADILNVRDPRVESVKALTEILDDGEIPSWTSELVVSDLAEAREVAARLESLPEVKEVYTIDSFLPEEPEMRLGLFGDMREALTTPAELTDDEKGQGEDPIEILRWTIEGLGVALDIDEELRLDEPGGVVIAEAERLRVALETLDPKLDDPTDPADIDALEESVFSNLGEVVDDIIEILPMQTIELEDLPADLTRRYLAPDGRARLEVLPSADLHDRDAIEHFGRVVRAADSRAGGTVVAVVEHVDVIVGALRQALTTSVVVIGLMLLALWRSFKYAVITMTPLLIGAACTAAFTVVFDRPFNMANVVVLPLILGIGVDSGIHLVHRHRSGLYGAPNLLDTGTARAVLFAALTTMLSFATLGFSNHGGMSSLSHLLVAGVGLTLIANLLVLPAILTWIDPR